MTVDRDRFNEGAERLGLDEFERIAVAELLDQCEATADQSERERLSIEIGALIEHHIERWLTEGGR